MKVTIDTNLTENVHLVGTDKDTLKGWLVRNGFEPTTFNFVSDGAENDKWHYYGSKVLETQVEKDINI